MSSYISDPDFDPKQVEIFKEKLTYIKFFF